MSKCEVNGVADSRKVEAQFFKPHDDIRSIVFLVMKKQFFTVGVIALMGLGVFLASCGKDDDDGGTETPATSSGIPANGCVCDIMDEDGVIINTENYSQKELSEYSSCEEYASFVRRLSGYTKDTFVCRNR
ncbi:MAG: hypothetical protein LBV41_13215 [Cytophagaceae bacterium]|jgi:hypothetical protein|nr:hypothetical protein [Cytophagaceae bacterium]